MTAKPSTIPSAIALSVESLITATDAAIASRVLARWGGGTVTLFAFDAGQRLSEHTTPCDALLLVLDGTFELTIGGDAVRAAAGSIVRLPAQVPHAVCAVDAARMLLVMLREPVAAPTPAAG